MINKIKFKINLINNNKDKIVIKKYLIYQFNILNGKYFWDVFQVVA